METFFNKKQFLWTARKGQVTGCKDTAPASTWHLPSQGYEKRKRQTYFLQYLNFMHMQAL